MKWLLVALFSLLPVTRMPLMTDTTVKADKITVFVQYEANPANTDITVAVKALDSTPPEWANATVYHVWFVGPDASHFNDEWPNMRTGHFRVWVTLHRTNGFHITAPAVDVEIK